MATLQKIPKSRTTGRKWPVSWIVLGVVAAVGVLWLLSGFFGGKSSGKKKSTNIVNVMPVLPPPPPPPPQPTPPPPEPEQAPPPDAPEFVEEKAPDAPPDTAPDEPEPMGSNIEGNGPADAFGLTGKGGGGKIGGRGNGGGQGSKFGWYAGRVQNAVSGALRNHRLTRTASMAIAARIWVDSSGRVSRAVIEGSSGDREIDRALEQEVLNRISLGDAPPEGMPMPIVMRINAKRP